MGLKPLSNNNAFVPTKNPFTIDCNHTISTKMCHNILERINKPHMAESYKWSEQGWDDSDSCRTSMSEPPQPSHRVGRCKSPIDNVRSRYRNNAGNCESK